MNHKKTGSRRGVIFEQIVIALISEALELEAADCGVEMNYLAFIGLGIGCA